MSSVDTSLFTPELVFIDFDVADRTDFFRKLGAELDRLGYIKDTWYDAILTRERNYPTGLLCPTGPIAIPHTDPEHLVKPYIAVVKPKDPVVFEPMANVGDDVPAELIVNLGISHADGQVQALESLMNIFLDEAAMADVMSQTTPEGLLDAIVSRL